MRTTLRLSALLTAILVGVPNLSADDHSWNVSSGYWTDNDNWSPWGVPESGDDAIVANGGTATFNIVSQNVSVGSLTLRNGTVGGATGTITATSGFFAESGTIGASLAGSGGLTKQTAGTVILSGANSYAGGTNIQGGTLQLGDNNALPTDSAVSIAGAATLALNGMSPTIGPLAMGGGTVNGRGFGGTLTLHGNVSASASGMNSIFGGTLALGGARDVTVADGGSLAISSSIVGSGGSLTKRGLGQMTISGSGNTYDGGTTVVQGNLAVAADGALGSGDVSIRPGARLIVFKNYSLDNNFLVDGLLSSDAGFLLHGGKTLSGSGQVSTQSGALTVAAGATVAPGDGPGALSVLSNAVFQSDSTLAIELNGPAPTEYDRLAVTGDVTLTDCLLSIDLGYAPAMDASFLVLDNRGAGAIAGEFHDRAEGARFFVPYEDEDFWFEITYRGGLDENDIVLTVVPEPGTLSLLLAGLAAVWLLRFRMRRVYSPLL